MGYKGSAEKVPPEYWEYRLVDEHFKGNWLVYWMMPEPDLYMIMKIREAEFEGAKLQERRMKQNARQTK